LRQPGPTGIERDFPARAARALVRAAEKLGVDPDDLAVRLENGEIAELVTELRLSRYLYRAGYDSDRLDDLLTRISATRKPHSSDDAANLATADPPRR